MSAIFGKQLFQETCCVTALLSCVCKVIQYAVLTKAGTKVGPDQLGPPVRVGSTRIVSDHEKKT